MLTTCVFYVCPVVRQDRSALECLPGVLPYESHVSLKERPELTEIACRPGTALLLHGAWPACALMPNTLCAFLGAQCAFNTAGC